MAGPGELFQLQLFMLRNLVFFAAVLAMNYTLSRPSPVDFLFVASFALSLFIRHRMHAAVLILFILLGLWAFSFYAASIPYLGQGEVGDELFKKTFVVALAIISAYVGSSWGERQYHRFFSFYVASCVVAASLGIIGFVLQIDELLWDDRARGFIDDPNMYGSFLIPGALASIYFFHSGSHRIFYASAGGVITLGILFSFSRAATAALLFVSFMYIVILYRKRILRLTAAAVAAAIVMAALFTAAFALIENFSDKFLERATFAADYDRGREGRYARYARSLHMILENPTGLGINQQDEIFAEPIHNIFLSSFLNYGWLAGVAWLLTFIGSLWLAKENFHSTGSPIVGLLTVSFLGPVLCANLHEGEHWRHLWLFLGLLWGLNPRNFPRRAGIAVRADGDFGRQAPTRLVTVGDRQVP
jgi:hypothetical protein